MLPPAPGRLSTTTCWPSLSFRRGTSMRTTASALPPGGKVTTMRMGLATGRVAAHQLNAVRIRQGQQAARKRLQKGRVGRRQRQCQRQGQRLRATGGQIAQVDRQGLVPQPRRVHRRQKVPPLHQHVAGNSQLHARCRLHQRTVVATPAPRGAPGG
jgi:hypothetical protein